MKCMLLILRQLFGRDSTWPGSWTCFFLLLPSPGPFQPHQVHLKTLHLLFPLLKGLDPPDNQSSQNVNLRDQRLCFCGPLHQIPSAWHMAGGG